MKAFLDFEASSLSDGSYPIEVAWVFGDGCSESHLIRPAPSWTEWDTPSEAVHGIGRTTLDAERKPHDAVAHRMVEALSAHDLFASAPSWDGKWLSVLLRAERSPRHALRLRDTDEALRKTAAEVLRPVLPQARLDREVDDLVARLRVRPEGPPAHRALPDAVAEHAIWCRVRDAARALAAEAA